MFGSKRGIPSFEKNSVIKLIIASGIGFVSFHLIRVILLVVGDPGDTFPTMFMANVAMPAVDSFLLKFWTIFTYGWVHSGFWVLFSNMVWLYVFGSLVQMLIGHRQVVPIFIYCLLVGGVFYQLAQLLPGLYFNGREYMMGAQAGVVGLSVAGLTISPNYRFHLTETFRVPLAIVAIFFYALQVMHANVNVEGAPLFILLGGAAMGYSYIVLMRNGINLGNWIFAIYDKLEAIFTPDDRAAVNRESTRRNIVMSGVKHKTVSQKHIDDILDKINQKGYDALSKEEKEALLKASKDDKA